MKIRSITNRNLAGGFWGGILGILLCSHHWSLLPVGCLIGVVAGFWYQEIIEKFKADWVVTKADWKRHAAQTKKSFLRPWRVYKVVCRRINRVKNKEFLGTFDFVEKAIRWILFAFFWIISKIVQAITWPTKNAYNGMITMTVATYVCFIMATIYILFEPIYNAELNSDPASRGTYFLLCSVGLLLTHAVTFGHQLIYLGEKRDRLLKLSAIEFLGFQLLHTTWIFFRVLCCAIIGILYLGAGAIITLGFIALPILAAVQLSRAWLKFAQQKAHWLCFAACLVMTTATAIICHNHLQGPLLWFAALVAGTLSGLAAEGLRMFAGYTERAIPRLVSFAQKQWDQDPINTLVIFWGKYSRIVKPWTVNIALKGLLLNTP